MGRWIEAPARERRRRGLLGWRILIAGALATLAVLGAVGLSAYVFFYLPQDTAHFARLTGPARRLAIYDAFVAQINDHYYDQSFSGFDWPKLRREWRSKAAAEPDDWGLYNDVFVQVTQRFPASHVSATPPSAPVSPAAVAATRAPASAASPSCSDRDAGVDMERVRRGKFVSFIVGEVWPASAAARAGVTPGSLVGSGQWGEGRFKAALIQLTPDQTHLFENTGSVQFSGHALQTIEFQYPCGAPDEPFETRRLPSGALYIRFDAFEAPILNRVEAALKTAGDHGVVLDLRHNPGGYVDQALDFLLPGSIPTYIYLDSYGKHPIYTEKSTWRYGGPLVVLVGPASASAAEITAAVLKHEHRAVIIGRRTNGSVLGSIAFPLPDGGKVQVPVSDVEMLDGQRLEDVGVAPDIEVFPGLADLRAGIDPALVRAERELASGGVKRR